ncbi:hypothetical protein O9929_01915 [Vibrio lentus]|nr:hypothetical protein [Vibrio lentus]
MGRIQLRSMMTKPKKSWKHKRLIGGQQRRTSSTSYGITLYRGLKHCR